MNLMLPQRTWAWLLFLVVLGVLRATHVIGEAGWFIATGAVALVALVVFLIRLDHDASR
jgi:hypothetical protein